jgi:hypothetical protein
MGKIRALFSILFIITFSSPLFADRSDNSKDYDVVIVVQDDSDSATYDIIKIDETYRSNPIKLEHCSEKCEIKIKEYIRLDNTPSKEYVSFQIELKIGSSSHSFKFKSKQALIACRSELKNYTISYNDGRFSGELRPNCNNSFYSLLQRDRDYKTVKLSYREEGAINPMRSIAKIEYKQIKGHQGTKKYFRKDIA